MILPPELIEEINKKDAIDQVVSFTVLGTTYVAMTIKRLNSLTGRSFYTTPAADNTGKRLCQNKDLDCDH